MILDRNFNSIDILNETISKIQEIITAQKNFEAMNNYDEYKSLSVAIENDQEDISFILNSSDFEKSKLAKHEIKCENGLYSLFISQNLFNPNTFMLYLKCNCIGENKEEGGRNFCSKSKLSARISKQNYSDQNVFINCADESLLTADKPEVLVGKILLLSEGIPVNNQNIKLIISIEELKSKYSNLEVDMLIGLQSEITKMIVDLLTK